MSKICLFGDSISKGVVIDEIRNRYTMTKRSFANLLTACEPELDLTNYSMLGCTISKGKSMIARHIRDVESCDVTVLEYGGNDSDHDWKEISENPLGDHLPKTPIDEFAESYREIIGKLNEMGKSIIMLNLPPIDEHKYFNWFSKGLDGENILKWLGGSEKYIYRFHEIYNVQVCNIAAEYNIPLIDIRSAFLEKRDYSEYLCNDGIHPNEKGHELIAGVITDALPNLVQEVSKRMCFGVGA
ncbi:MAG: SGNH/GDSL hydrolase family protein [Clostridiales bacterium]|jgi:acyl-CoA thioesterase-1|nr:SGNH/GDSL hydrolase family protein [Clostridiales bacterium]